MADEQKAPILNQTLGDILRNNPQAQNMVMQALRISPEQLQQMLAVTGNDPRMNMSIGDLFKTGVVQQAQDLSKGVTAAGIDMQGAPAQGVPVIGQVPIVSGQAVPVSKEQFQQILGMMQNGQVQGIPQISGQMVQMGQLPVQQGSSGVEMLGQNQNMLPFQMTGAEPQKMSFLEKVKNLFK